VLEIVLPLAEHAAVCLQVEPSAMEKMKSKSVSYETETCISVMENCSLDPHEIFGALLDFFETWPLMHLDYWSQTVSRVVLKKIHTWKSFLTFKLRFEKEFAQENP